MGLILLLLVQLSLPFNAFAGDTLRLSAFDAPGLTPVALKTLAKAYSRLGIAIETVVTEPSRALVNSSSGTTDGEVVRIALVDDRYPSLVRVNVPLLSVTTYGYTNKPELLDKSVDMLKAFRAGHVRGAVFGELAARDSVEIWSADEPEQLFEMLKQDRIDVVYVREIRAEEMIARFGLEDVLPIPASFKEYPFYHYLHERHLELVPRVEKALRDLQGESEVAAGIGKGS
jgi:ABC-type amino acid transport substrate-binding protein